MQPNQPQQNDAPQEPINNHEPTIIRPSNSFDTASQQEQQTPQSQPAASTPQQQPAQPQPEQSPQNNFVNNQPQHTQAMQQPAFQQPQPTQQSSGVPAQPFPPQKKSKNKLVLASGVFAFLLLAGSLGYVFGIYLPNTPENVWKTGLSRTGEEVEAVVEKFSDPEAFETLAKNKVTISGGAKTSGQSYTLDVNSAFDKESSDSTLDFSTTSDSSSQDFELNAKVKTQLVEDSVWPNIYFNISGFSSLGLDTFFPEISKYDGKWIAVEQDFYGDIAGELSEDSDVEAVENITQQDIVSIADDVVSVAQGYLFTTDPDKAVLIMDEFVGSEESEGITAYHYKASQNLDNSVAFCKAIASKLINDNDAYRKINNITSANSSDKLQDAHDDCDFTDEEKEEAQNDKPLDIWMDKNHKLFHKVRLYEDIESKNAEYRQDKKECEENYSSFGTSSGDNSVFCSYYDDSIEEGERYTEVGQVYDGNDSMRLFVNYISDTNKRKDTLQSTLAIDINTLSVDGQFDYENTTNENSQTSASFTIKTEGYEGEINATRPTDAVDLQTLLEELQLQPPQALGDNTENEEPQLEPTEEVPTAREIFVEFLQKVPFLN